MRVLLLISLGMLIGVYGPPLIVWALTIEEHHRHQVTSPRRRRATVDDLLEGIGTPRGPRPVKPDPEEPVQFESEPRGPRPVPNTRREARHRRH